MSKHDTPKLEVRQCRKPWVETYVHVNGDVKPCCYSHGVLGNVLDVGDLNALTDGAVMQEVKSFIRQNKIHPICSGASCIYVASKQAQPGDFADASAWRAAIARNYGIPPEPEGLILTDSLMHDAQIGEKGAMFKVGLALYNAKLHVEAVAWLQAASAARSDYADHMLGTLYMYGLGVEKDVERAKAYFRKAAAEGHSQSFTALGKLALQGLGGDAAELFKQGGERGDPDGYYELALIYREGETVEKNGAEAMRYLRLAATRGHLKAKEELAEKTL